MQGLKPRSGFSLLRKAAAGGQWFCKSLGKEAVASPIFMRLCICALVRLCVCAFVRLCVCEFVRLCACAFVRLCAVLFSARLGQAIADQNRRRKAKQVPTKYFL